MALKLARNWGQQEAGERNSLRMLGFQANLKMLKFHEDAVMLHGRWRSLWTPCLGIYYSLPPPSVSRSGIEMAIAMHHWRRESTWEPLAQRGHEELTVFKLQVLPSITSAHLDGNCSILRELQQLWTGHLPLFRCSARKRKQLFWGEMTMFRK